MIKSSKILLSAVIAMLIMSNVTTPAYSRDEQGRSSGVVFDGAGGD